MKFKEDKFALAAGFTYAACFFVRKILFMFFCWFGVAPWWGMLKGGYGLMRAEKVAFFDKAAGAMFVPFWGPVILGTLFAFVLGYVVGWLFSWIYNQLI